jgi:transcriptional regulator with GAF, ATPase, and Fis domain
MIQTFRQVSGYARLDRLPVVISGESGTGKESLALAIHALDTRRRTGAFVAVNCAAITPTIAESELFGHRRGAFTGAERNRRGLIRSADAGVLFLDEIGELSIEIQGKLLRVLQEQRVQGVGEEREEHVDIRVVAATNRDLKQMVEAGQFRLDLFHRLNVLPVRVAPLRERPEDIEPLVGHFAARHSTSASGSPRVTPEFVSALARLSLPGNVREVENLVIQALANRGESNALALAHLPRETLMELAMQHSSDARTSESMLCRTAHEDLAQSIDALAEATGWNLSRALTAYEGMFVGAALRRSAHKKSEAARLLGVTPRTIYNLMRRHHLNKND